MSIITGIDTNPTEGDSPCIFWRVKVRQQDFSDTQAIGQFHANVLSMSKTITGIIGPSAFLENFLHALLNDKASSAGKLFKEDGIASLLLFMAMMNVAPSQIAINLSHEDGVEISNQIKLESKALSFFDTDLETVRPVAEALGLLEKRLDLSAVASSQQDFYF